jgi:hypothetical protein
MSETEPYPEIDPSLYSGPFLPAGRGASPLGSEGSLSQIPLTQKGKGLGDGASLGSSSIIDTISEIPPVSQLLEPQGIGKLSPGTAAWKALGTCDPLIKKKYKDLLFGFCNYLSMCERTGFKAKGYCPKGNGNGKREITGPLLNRWHPIRRAAWIARLYQLTQWYEATKPGCTMISLTGYQDDLSIYETWDSINESRVKLLKLCRKHLGKIDYLWVVEPHTEKGTGYPHYHLVVFANVSNETTDKRGEGMEDKLRRMWSEEWNTGSHTYGLDFQHLSGDEGIKNLKNYLLKYISKGYVTQGWGQSELVFNAHLYGATHGYRGDPNVRDTFEETKIYRLIGMSRPLSKLLKPEETENKEQIIWYHVDETEPTETKNEKGEITEDHDCKPMYDRSPFGDGVGSIIPLWLMPFRDLVKPYDPNEWKRAQFKARLEREWVSQDWSD